MGIRLNTNTRKSFTLLRGQLAAVEGLAPQMRASDIASSRRNRSPLLSY